MGKRLTYLIIIALLWGLIPTTAGAQNGVCPDDVYPLPPLGGSYPGDLLICAPNPSDAQTPTTVIYDLSIPCNGALTTTNSISSAINGEWDTLQIVPPAYQSFYGLRPAAHVSWLIRGVTMTYQEYTSDFFIELKSYTETGSLIQTKIVQANTAPVITKQGLQWFYVDTYIEAQQRGYFELTVTYPSPLILRRFQISMLRITDQSEPFPPPCPDITLPAPAPTPTPFPTFAPPPTNTPAGTPTSGPTPTITSTPLPTSTPRTTPFPTAESNTPGPGGGGGPPTATPYTSEIVTAELTMTAPAVPTIANVNVPPITNPISPLPTIAPIQIPTTTITGTQQNTVTLEAINWLTETNESLTSFISGTTTTTTWISGGISGTSAISAAQTMAYYVASPIAYTRGLALYMPNLWPYIFALLIMTAWIIINITVKYGIGLLSAAYKLFISAIDFVLKWIPFFG